MSQRQKLKNITVYPKPTEILPVESIVKNYKLMKSYKITGKPTNQDLGIFDS